MPHFHLSNLNNYHNSHTVDYFVDLDYNCITVADPVGTHSHTPLLDTSLAAARERCFMK